MPWAVDFGMLYCAASSLYGIPCSCLSTRTRRLRGVRGTMVVQRGKGRNIHNTSRRHFVAFHVLFISPYGMACATGPASVEVQGSSLSTGEALNRTQISAKERANKWFKCQGSDMRFGRQSCYDFALRMIYMCCNAISNRCHGTRLPCRSGEVRWCARTEPS